MEKGVGVARFGEVVRSVSRDGLGWLEQGEKLKAEMGQILIDMVSAPVPPGEYHLALAARAGGGEVFLPRCARLVAGGSSLLGGRRELTGTDHWPYIAGRLRNQVKLPEEIPAYALETFEKRPVTVRISFDVFVGGFTIYRL